MLIRQGDLALVPDAAPASTAAPKLLTLAIGEDSGHMHQITGALADGLLTIAEPAALVIGPDTAAWRHDPIMVPAGTYAPRVQREYTPAGAREVGD